MAGVYEHLIHNDLFIEGPCVVVEIRLQGKTILRYGFHLLERGEIEEGVLFRVMRHSGHTYFDADVMQQYTAHISIPGKKDLVGEFDEVSGTFKFYYENH